VTILGSDFDNSAGLICQLSAFQWRQTSIDLASLCYLICVRHVVCSFVVFNLFCSITPNKNFAQKSPSVMILVQKYYRYIIKKRLFESILMLMK